MTLRTLNRLMIIGFGLIYFAVMGSLVVLSMPQFDGYRLATFQFVMLPAAILGAVLIAIEKTHGVASDEKLHR